MKRWKKNMSYKDIEFSIELRWDCGYELFSVNARGHVTDRTGYSVSFCAPFVQGFIEFSFVPRASVHSGSKLCQLLHNSISIYIHMNDEKQKQKFIQDLPSCFLQLFTRIVHWYNRVYSVEITILLLTTWN